MQPQSRRQDPPVPRMGMLRGWLGTYHTARTCQRAQHGGRGPQTPYGHVSAPQGSPSPDAENQGVEDPPGTLPGLRSAPLTPYLGLDVLVRGSHQTGTAQPQHHHDGEEEAGGQDPARKARAPVTPHQPPPKKKDEFMAGHGVGTGRGSNCSGVSGRSSPSAPAQPRCTYLDMQPRKSCSGGGGSGCCALALPRGSFTGGFSPFARGPGSREGMLSPGTRCGHISPTHRPLASP